MNIKQSRIFNGVIFLVSMSLSAGGGASIEQGVTDFSGDFLQVIEQSGIEALQRSSSGTRVCPSTKEGGLLEEAVVKPFSGGYESSQHVSSFVHPSKEPTIKTAVVATIFGPKKERIIPTHQKMPLPRRKQKGYRQKDRSHFQRRMPKGKRSR